MATLRSSDRRGDGSTKRPGGARRRHHHAERERSRPSPEPIEGDRGGTRRHGPASPRRCRSTAWTSLLDGEIGGARQPQRARETTPVFPAATVASNRRRPDRIHRAARRGRPIAWKPSVLPARPDKSESKADTTRVAPHGRPPQRGTTRPPAMSPPAPLATPCIGDGGSRVRCTRSTAANRPSTWPRSSRRCARARGRRAPSRPPRYAPPIPLQPASPAPCAQRPRIASAPRHCTGTPRRRRLGSGQRAGAVRREALDAPARDARRDRHGRHAGGRMHSSRLDARADEDSAGPPAGPARGPRSRHRPPLSTRRPHSTARAADHATPPPAAPRGLPAGPRGEGAGARDSAGGTTSGQPVCCRSSSKRPPRPSASSTPPPAPLAHAGRRRRGAARAVARLLHLLKGGAWRAGAMRPAPTCTNSNRAWRTASPRARGGGRPAKRSRTASTAASRSSTSSRPRRSGYPAPVAPIRAAEAGAGGAGGGARGRVLASPTLRVCAERIDRLSTRPARSASQPDQVEGDAAACGARCSISPRT